MNYPIVISNGLQLFGIISIGIIPSAILGTLAGLLIGRRLKGLPNHIQAKLSTLEAREQQIVAMREKIESLEDDKGQLLADKSIVLNLVREIERWAVKAKEWL